ncbi:MAG TPA: TauD/TfdA family dioxygenase, partial [Ilumatobacteraceae bacterium]|nr:TauD/TfdA family dioxygenase [Ilumatobacteraceae bacterium]
MDLQVTPLSGALGAVVDDVDLRDALNGGASIDPAAIRALLDEYLVVFFPGQHLTDDQHLRVGLTLGEGYIHPLGRMFGKTQISAEHIRDTPESPPYQDEWHTDVSWDPDPPRVGLLRAIEMPVRGGDTVWASAYAAYDALDDATKASLEGLTAIHDMGRGKAFETKMGPELVART